MLEENVAVKRRAVGKLLVQDCLAAAAVAYSKLIRDQIHSDKHCNLCIDDESLPPARCGEDGPSCPGGVCLACANGKITIHDTIDLMLKIVMSHKKPSIRAVLFTLEKLTRAARTELFVLSHSLHPNASKLA